MQQLTDNFVIIAGVAKCGTTSVFDYLSDHPDICPSLYKEPRFFSKFDIEQKMSRTPWTSGFFSQPLEHYLTAFVCAGQEKYKLEASATYIYTERAAQYIKQSLPQVKLIFIFRDPIQRFVSHYRFRRQQHIIPNDMTLASFLQTTRDNTMPQMKNALELGNYAMLLKPFWELFDHKHMLLLGFNRLKANPTQLMKDICSFLDIDGSFYSDYTFERKNSTVNYRNATIDELQRKITYPIRHQLQRYPRVYKVVHAVNKRTWMPLYDRLNARPIDKDPIPPDVMAFLQDYYKDVARDLYDLTGRDDLLT